MAAEDKRWSGALVVALACALLSGASFGITILDFGAHVDGPGIGLEWSRPLGSEYGMRSGIVLALVVVHAALSLFAFRRAGSKPIGFLSLPAVGFVGMLANFVVAGRALPAWWKLGCNQGHAYACYAAAGVTDGAESDALDERACAGDVGSACRRIALRDPARRLTLCAARADACSVPLAQRAPHGRCHALEEVCADVPPASSAPPGR